LKYTRNAQFEQELYLLFGRLPIKTFSSEGHRAGDSFGVEFAGPEEFWNLFGFGQPWPAIISIPSGGITGPAILRLLSIKKGLKFSSS